VGGKEGGREGGRIGSYLGEYFQCPVHPERGGLFL
jgi:hypothetical protein